MVAQQAGVPPPPASILLAGIVPPLADSFYQRPETGLVLRNGLYPGDTVVLTQALPERPADRSPTWPGPGWSAWTPPARSARYGCTGACRPRCAAYLPAAELDTVVVAAADALMQAWPNPAGGVSVTGGGGEQGSLIQVLRDCAGALPGGG